MLYQNELCGVDWCASVALGEKFKWGRPWKHIRILCWVRDTRLPRRTVSSHSSRQNHSTPVCWTVLGVMQRIGQLAEMCPRRTSQLGGGCGCHPQGLFQDLRAHPSSHAKSNKTSAILADMGNKGNCYVAYEYKYTRSLAMEWRSVLFHCTSPELEVGHADRLIDYLYCMIVCVVCCCFSHFGLLLYCLVVAEYYIDLILPYIT